MRWPWRMQREWKRQAEQAAAEAEHSRRELQWAREEIIAPLSRLQERNHFADLIRASLHEGKDGR